MLMRIESDFAKDRISEKRLYNSKVFIAYEGSRSEVIYFKGLNKSVLTEEIEIISLLRDYENINSSHPNFIIEMYKEFLLNNDKKISKKELINKLKNFNRDNGFNEEIDKFIKKIDIIDEIINYEEIANILLSVFKGKIYEEFINNFNKYIESQNITYSPVTDSLNLVIDRDKDNFTESQYENVLKFSLEHNINMYVSNPTFELWLLMHFDNIFEYDKNKLLENEKISSKRRFIENELHKICNYNKTIFDFKIFENKINNAINNEKKFSEDINELKTCLGSNVGILVQTIISHTH